MCNPNSRLSHTLTRFFQLGTTPDVLIEGDSAEFSSLIDEFHVSHLRQRVPFKQEKDGYGKEAFGDRN
jgi:hypothetical protein